MASKRSFGLFIMLLWLDTSRESFVSINVVRECIDMCVNNMALRTCMWATITLDKLSRTLTDSCQLWLPLELFKTVTSIHGLAFSVPDYWQNLPNGHMAGNFWSFPGSLEAFMGTRCKFDNSYAWQNPWCINMITWYWLLSFQSWLWIMMVEMIAKSNNGDWFWTQSRLP